MSSSTNPFPINEVTLEQAEAFGQAVGIDPNAIVQHQPWTTVESFFHFFTLEKGDVEENWDVRLGWGEFVTLDTLLIEYLAFCQQRGGNETDDCRSFTWAYEYENLPLGEALSLLKSTDVALESAIWALDNMLPFLSIAVREHFCEVISQKGTHALQSLNWRRIVRGHRYEGSPSPSVKEDILLRGQWHSSYVGGGKLPLHEEES